MTHHHDCGRPVLIVEDDEDVRETIAEVLEDQHISWIAAPNGAEALAALERAPSPCVILLDLMMPVMDGWEFRRVLLEDPRLAEVPVVILSAHSDLQKAAAALRAAAHLPKPIQLERLVDVVEEHCGSTG